MYSKIDILKAIKAGYLKVTPFDKRDLKPNALSLHLDNKIAVAKKGTVDPLRGSFSKLFKEKTLGSKEQFKVRPGQLVLARTREKISISRKLAVFIQGRSTLARLGLSVTQTAMVIEAGHGVPEPRKIVLEISNSGPIDVILTPGMKIAKVTVFELDTPSDVLYDSYGKYGTRKDKDALLPLKE